MFHRTLSFLALSLGPMALAMSCADKVVSCEEGKTCLREMTDSGGGSTTVEGDGGTGGDGGTSSGGATGDGDGDTGSGGVVIDPCDACDGEAPVCVDDECVACSDTDTGACAEDQVCSPENACVECLDNTHCTEADASLCDMDTNTCTGCEDNESCAHLDEAGTLLCDTESASCVACLTEDDCGGKVCDPDTHSCTNLPAGQLFQCEPCQYDAQCMPGRLCVEHLYPFDPEASNPQTVGTFCTWTKEAVVGEKSGGCYENGTPFVGDATLPSVNNTAPTDFCVLATTTCEGYADHRQPNCTGIDDDASCGADGVNDAQCELKSATYLCTYPCLGNEDCKSGSTCSGGGYCSL